MKSSAMKLLIGFIIGAITVGGYAIAIPNNVPVVKACIDNKTKALFVSTFVGMVLAGQATISTLDLFVSGCALYS